MNIEQCFDMHAEIISIYTHAHAHSYTHTHTHQRLAICIPEYEL